MRLLRVAVENKRWDLAAHTIILATATILNNGNKTVDGKKDSNHISLKNSTVKKVRKSR
jgi:hypothetical protein